MNSPQEQPFQVDLRGVVDLLSHHLYSSPRVYVRELLQNAADAITARRARDPDAPGRVVIEPLPDDGDGDGVLRVSDTGIGLRGDEVYALLATIGRSSKRDDLGFARHEFLGQFGIGLLSCFLVADEIQVDTRAVDATETVRWTGFADGRYRIGTAPPRPEPGTTVTLRPRSGMADWLRTTTVTELARTYGALLPCDVDVAGERVTVGAPPWLARYDDPDRRRRALTAHAVETVGFTPFDVIDLSVPEAGLTGVAYVLPTPANPTERAAHRVYLKRMLLSENTQDLAPEWAFFARCVVDTAELRPTASREALYDDDLLATTRQAIGDRLRAWLIDLAATDPDRMTDFLSVHHLGVKALAVHDDEMLRIVDRWLPFETAEGPHTLAEFRTRHDVIRYAATIDEFRQLAGVAAAQGIGLVNAAYTYDEEILRRLAAVDPGVTVVELDADEVATRLDAVDSGTELDLRPFLDAARRALDRLGCDVLLRAYEPVTVPALYLTTRAAEQHAELTATREVADELWAEVLSALDRPRRVERPRLVLNHRNPLIRRIGELAGPAGHSEHAGLVDVAVESLYGQALLIGHHPLRPDDAAALNRSFLGLLEWAVHRTEER